MPFITASVCTLYFFVTSLVFTVYGALDATTYPKLSAKHRLMPELFGDYNKNILPSENNTSPVTVYVYVHLLDLIDLDESTETLEVLYWLWQDWRDVRLQWDPTKYSNVTYLTVLASSIWTPDIMPFNR
ncbi:neuronal acetylcholine receptor subunit alpha-6-like [Gigantopelta aegis]|uniref:neuronal acetylcholine receptor subunit alpha-6-like n=1 Tax=Gigantopelta aegis TaxID=1735272 RepID=UPI001B88B378|nr:neuronal acetylcholine receptor subunit alpha-6-like [Gigantopelta aegis]